MLEESWNDTNSQGQRRPQLFDGVQAPPYVYGGDEALREVAAPRLSIDLSPSMVSVRDTQL